MVFVFLKNTLSLCRIRLNARDTEINQKLCIMAYKSSEDCIACGTCAGECPQGAIHEGDIYVIDPDVCIDCGTCADACPMGAIAPAE